MYKIVGLLVIIIASLQLAVAQEDLPQDFVAEVLPYKLDKPVGIVFTFEGQGYIWEKEGVIKVLTKEGQLLDEPLLDLREEVLSQGDHGIVGFALDPAFKSNGHYYVYYAVDRHHLMTYGTSEYDPETTWTSQATICRITRYTASANTNFTTTDTDTRKVLVGKTPSDGFPILMISHATGSLIFGEDGTLMVSCGDSGSFTEDDKGNAKDTYHEQALEDDILTPMHNVGAYRSMQISSPNGKVLRINPETGAGYPSNPYYQSENPQSHQSRVWSMGFRNPYKFMLVPNTGAHLPEEGDPGTLILGDVGSSLWEEINVIEGPAEWFGWPYFEGFGGKWGFWDKRVPNLEAPRTEGDVDCPDYYTFDQLYSQVREEGQYSFIDVCRDKPINDALTFVHKTPILSYSSVQWNPPAKTHVQGFDSLGFGKGLSIQDPIAGIEGALIEGGTSLPGAIDYFGNFPEKYKEKLFLADYAGFIKVVELTDDFSVKSVEPFLNDKKGITDLTFNPASGSLYYIHVIQGKIVKVTFGGVLPPQIIADQNKTFGATPLDLVIDASASISGSETALTYEWTINGNVVQSGPVYSETFTTQEVQTYEIQLTITDSLGLSSTETFRASVNNTPPTAAITSIPEGQQYSLDAINTMILEAEAVDAEHSLDELTFGWRVDLYHDTHFHPGPVDERQSTIALLDPVGCELEQYWYKIILTVTDPEGLSTEEVVEMFPNCDGVDPIVTNLSGLSVDREIQLAWEVDLPTSISKYVIEKSDDFLFLPLAEISGDVTNFIDDAPYVGTNKYRIKYFDTEGRYGYTNAIEVTSANETLFIYPNPVQDELSVLLKIEENISATVQILSLSGQLLKTITVQSDETGAISNSIAVTDLPSGTYIARVDYGDGASSQKFVKM